MTDKIVVISTCSTHDEAARLARLLVTERLAACVNVIPQIRSFYRWKGAVEESDECLLLIKSSRSLFASLSALIEKEHSYDVPEVLAISAVDGAGPYLRWLDESLVHDDAALE